jgi:AcrR family transcriptional regulator
MTTLAARGQKRRQARGQRRIDQLLDVAARVFAEVGFEAATTNGIAARAGVSPGSLYQFFPNKDAMAEALATASQRASAIRKPSSDPKSNTCRWMS